MFFVFEFYLFRGDLNLSVTAADKLQVFQVFRQWQIVATAEPHVRAEIFSFNDDWQVSRISMCTLSCGTMRYGFVRTLTTWFSAPLRVWRIFPPQKLRSNSSSSSSSCCLLTSESFYDSIVSRWNIQRSAMSRKTRNYVDRKLKEWWWTANKTFSLKSNFSFFKAARNIFSGISFLLNCWNRSNKNEQGAEHSKIY